MYRLLWWLIVPGVLLACTEPVAVLPLQHATLLETPHPIAPFELTDQTGARFSHPDLAGRWTLMFSGFTHCPDTCPLTLSQLRDAEQQLTGKRHHRMVFVSVDPERDNSNLLEEYLGWFDPEWTGLTGSDTELAPLLDSLGMAYVRVPLGSVGDYTVDHSTAVVLIDPKVRLVGYWKAPLDTRKLAEDLAALPAP